MQAGDAFTSRVFRVTTPFPVQLPHRERMVRIRRRGPSFRKEEHMGRHRFMARGKLLGGPGGIPSVQKLREGRFRFRALPQGDPQGAALDQGVEPLSFTDMEGIELPKEGDRASCPRGGRYAGAGRERKWSSFFLSTPAFPRLPCPRRPCRGTGEPSPLPARQGGPKSAGSFACRIPPHRGEDCGENLPRGTLLRCSS